RRRVPARGRGAVRRDVPVSALHDRDRRPRPLRDASVRRGDADRPGRRVLRPAPAKRHGCPDRGSGVLRGLRRRRPMAGAAARMRPFSVALLVLAARPVAAPQVPLSQRGGVTQMVGGTRIEIRYPYPEGRDALRIRVPARQGPHMETLAFYFPVVDGKDATLYLHWGTTIVPLEIRVE